MILLSLNYIAKYILRRTQINHTYKLKRNSDFKKFGFVAILSFILEIYWNVSYAAIN